MKTPRKKNKKMDGVLIACISILSLIGLIMVTSSSYPEGINLKNDGLFFLKRHILFLALGIIIAIITYNFPISWIRRFSFLFFVISVILCLLLIPFGINRYGSIRWLKIPIIKIDFMPSDIIKFTSVFYLADFLVKHKKDLNSFKTFFKILLIFGFSVGPVIIQDFSTGIVIGVTLLSIYFLMGIKLYQGIIIAMGGGSFLVLMLTKFSYRMERLFSFIDPFDDVPDTDWQLAHSLYAFGIGGFNGVGPFQSRLKQGYLPMAYNDFIFPILGEEWGFLGTFFLIAVYFFFTVRGLIVAGKASDTYKLLVAAGITVSIAIQAIFNMGVSVGLLPVTGLTLPFISYGGTSLVITFAVVGVLLRIASDVKGASK